jgi:nickel transport protein
MPAVRTVTRPAPVLAALLMLTWPAAGYGHAMLHELVEGDDTVLLRFSYPGGEQPWFEPYEVYAPGADSPFQTGHVNARGEVSFRPDTAGEWRVRVFTEDGHGAVVRLDIDTGRVATAEQLGHGHAHDHWLRVFAGLGYLLGVFGLLALWRARRARAGPD